MSNTPTVSSTVSYDATKSIVQRAKSDAPLETAGDSAAPKSEATSFLADLKAVDAYIASAHFGHVTRFSEPFSEQIKTDVRNRIPQDADTYNQADKVQKRSAGYYFALRSITALLFLAFVATAIAIYYECASLVLSHFPSLTEGRAALLAIVALVGVLFTLVRRGFRWLFLDLIIPQAVERLAHLVSTRFRNFEADTNKACGQIDSRSDFGTGQSWAQRAWGWARIALWNAIRTRGLDTYTTTVFWKMRVFDRDIERASRLLKGLLLVGALFALFYLESSPGQRVWISEDSIGISVAVWTATWFFLFVHRAGRFLRKWYVDLISLLLLYSVLATSWTTRGGGHVDLMTLLVGAILVIVFWWGWIFSNEREDEAWTKVFTRVLGLDGVAALNTAFYFTSVAARIRNLVDQIVDHERSQSQRGGTPPKAGGSGS